MLKELKLIKYYVGPHGVYSLHKERDELSRKGQSFGNKLWVLTERGSRTKFYLTGEELVELGKLTEKLKGQVDEEA